MVEAKPATEKYDEAGDSPNWNLHTILYSAFSAMHISYIRRFRGGLWPPIVSMVQRFSSRASEASEHDQQERFRPCKGDNIAFFTYAFVALYSKEESGMPDQDVSSGKELSTVVDGQDL